MQKHKLRIIYMGTPDFAVVPLQKLLEAGYEVVGVVTNPDKPAGRGQKLQETAVKKFAQEKGLKILQPERFRDKGFLQELAALKADLQVVVAFKMLPEVVWDMPPLGTVNLHASLLPDYRGAAPINWAIMNGECRSGVTTFLLSHEIDTGHLIYQQEVAIGETMTAGELHDCLMTVGADLLVKTVDAIEKRDFPLIDQQQLLKERSPLLAPKIFKENMKINWDTHVDQVYNHIRGLSPFPAAWTELKHKITGERIMMKVFRVRKEAGAFAGKSGEIRTDAKKYWEVCVPGGVIKLLEVQLAGKKRMSVEECLRGFKVEDYFLSF